MNIIILVMFGFLLIQEKRKKNENCFARERDNSL